VEVLKWLLTVSVLKTAEVLNGKTKVGTLGMKIHLRGDQILFKVSAGAYECNPVLSNSSKVFW